jgi:hypothetical protein
MFDEAKNQKLKIFYNFTLDMKKFVFIAVSCRCDGDTIIHKGVCVQIHTLVRRVCIIEKNFD